MSTTASTKNNNVFESTKRPTTKETTTRDPRTACHCGCTFSSEHGQFQTQYRKKQILCTWNFVTKPGYLVMVQMEKLSNLKWKQGGLFIASPNNMIQEFKGKSGGIEYEKMMYGQRAFTSIGNTMNLTLFNTLHAYDLDVLEIRFSYKTFRGMISLLFPYVSLTLSLPSLFFNFGMRLLTIDLNQKAIV